MRLQNADAQGSAGDNKQRAPLMEQGTRRAGDGRRGEGRGSQAASASFCSFPFSGRGAASTGRCRSSSRPLLCGRTISAILDIQRTSPTPPPRRASPLSFTPAPARGTAPPPPSRGATAGPRRRRCRPSRRRRPALAPELQPEPVCRQVWAKGREGRMTVACELPKAMFLLTAGAERRREADDSSSSLARVSLVPLTPYSRP